MPYLSESDKTKVLGKLQRDYKGCPQCGSLGSGSSLGELVGFPMLEKGVPSGVVPGPQVMPMLPVTCNSCGYTSFFPAMKYVDFDE